MQSVNIKQSSSNKNIAVNLAAVSLPVITVIRKKAVPEIRHKRHGMKPGDIQYFAGNVMSPCGYQYGAR